jgi:hypothetical protein
MKYNAFLKFYLLLEACPNSYGVAVFVYIFLVLPSIFYLSLKRMTFLNILVLTLFLFSLPAPEAPKKICVLCIISAQKIMIQLLWFQVQRHHKLMRPASFPQKKKCSGCWTCGAERNAKATLAAVCVLIMGIMQGI